MIGGGGGRGVVGRWKKEIWVAALAQGRGEGGRNKTRKEKEKVMVRQRKKKRRGEKKGNK